MINYDGYDEEESPRVEGKLYESSLISMVDKDVHVSQQLNEQKVCLQEVDGITILSLNVGCETPIVNENGQIENSVNHRLRGSMIEELLIRSDADFICLQNVPRFIYSQWV